jgi:hypothetical protein
VSKALPERAQGKSIEVWFQDEARVGQQGTLTRIWARRGTRPRGLRDRRYAWAYLFGAVCPKRAIGAALVLPYANAETMSLHLAEISCHVAPDAHAILVLDGAGWHGAADLAVPDNLTLLPLPPYSPELVWGFACQALTIAAPGRTDEGLEAGRPGRPTCHLAALSPCGLSAGSTLATRRRRWPATLDAADRPRHNRRVRGRIIVLHPFALIAAPPSSAACSRSMTGDDDRRGACLGARGVAPQPCIRSAHGEAGP